MRSEEQLSQTRCLASIVSGLATPPPPLQLLRWRPQAEGGSGTERCHGKNRGRSNGSAGTQAQSGAMGRGVCNRRAEASFKPSFWIRPHHLLLSHPLGGGGGGVSAYQDLPGLVWNQTLRMAMIGNFPAGGRLSVFSAGMAAANL